MARRSRAIRIGGWVVGGLLVLIIAGVVIFVATFDPNSYKPRIVAAVKQATGRDLVLQGQIHLGLSLQPTLTVQGVSLSNPPGFSRPQMATLQELDLKLALMPLLSHQVEIDRLVLIKPDILLEMNAQGQPNWTFKPEGGPAATPATTPSGSGSSSQTQINVAQLEVQNGTVTWRDDATQRSAVLGLTSLTTSAPSPDANLHLAMNASYNGNPFSLSGDVGPLTRLQDTTTKTAWPVQLTVQAVGAKLALNGSITQPEQARGYNLKVTASVPDLTALGKFAPAVALPPLHDINVAAQVTDTGAKLPNISNLTLHVGSSDLTGTVAGLKLDKLDVSAPKSDQPAQLSIQATFNNAPATLDGSAGLLPVLLSGGKVTAPLPMDLTAQALGSKVTVKGSAAYVNGRPSLQAAVQSDMLDADALIAALAKPAAPPAAAGGAPAAPAPSPAPRRARGRIFPDTPIPFSVLRMADADVKLNIAAMKYGGAQYKAIVANIDLHNGALKLDPLSAELPEGRLSGALTAADTPPAPPVSVRLDAPALAVGPLLAAAGKPGYLSGNVEVHANLSGAGASPHAIAASLNGTLGIAMANGTVDNRLLGSTLGKVLQAVNVLDLVGRGGASQVQCFAARLTTQRGVGMLNPFVLSSTLVTMEGGGTVNLGEEDLDLRLRPQGKLAGAPIVVPVRVTGSLSAPSVGPDPTAAVTANVGTAAGVAGTVLGTATPLGLVAGALGGQKLLGGLGGVDCGAALAAARGQAAPAPTAATTQAAPAPAQQQQQQQQKLPNPGQLLQKLFR